MKRHNGTGKLGGRVGMDEGEINPLDGVANLADIMLVFSCGLMLALITYWNVDVSGIKNEAVNVQQGQEVSDMAGLDQDSGEPVDDSSLQEYGKVYRDPATGKLYMITEGD